MGFFVYSFAKTCFTDRENEVGPAQYLESVDYFPRKSLSIYSVCAFVPHTSVYDYNVKAILGPKSSFFYRNSPDINILDHFRHRRRIFRKPGFVYFVANPKVRQVDTLAWVLG